MTENNGSSGNSIDLYEVLGVEPTADAADIREAYLRLAKENHPDLNAGDKDSEKRFKEISEAYAVLSNKTERRHYDFGERVASKPPSVSDDTRVTSAPSGTERSKTGFKLDLYRVAAFGGGVAAIGAAYLLFAFVLFDAQTTAEGDTGGRFAQFGYDRSGDVSDKKYRLKYEQMVSQKSSSADVAKSANSTVEISDQPAVPDSSQTSSSQISSSRSGTEVLLEPHDAQPSQQGANGQFSPGKAPMAQANDSANSDEVEVAALPPLQPQGGVEHAGAGREENASDVAGDRARESDNQEVRLGGENGQVGNLGPDADGLFDESMAVAPELVPVPNRNPSRLGGRSELAFGRWRDNHRGEMQGGQMRGDFSRQGQDHARVVTPQGNFPGGEGGLRPREPMGPGNAMGNGRRLGESPLDKPLPDGVTFRRWIISGGQLCWIKWSGGLKCGSELERLTERRRQYILSRMRREMDRRMRSADNYDPRLFQRRKSWVNEEGLVCWFGRDGYEVCERQ